MVYPLRYNSKDEHCFPPLIPSHFFIAYSTCDVRHHETVDTLLHREAGELRKLLAEGIAPEPPKLWSAKPGHLDVGEDDDALTQELLLCWRPQAGSAVRTAAASRLSCWAAQPPVGVCSR